MTASSRVAVGGRRSSATKFVFDAEEDGEDVTPQSAHVA
jgi:hypothetical protein